MKALDWLRDNSKAAFHIGRRTVQKAALGGGGAFAAAVEYLSPLPAFWNEAYDREDVQRSLMWFPVVGLLLGIVGGGATWFLGLFLPSLALGGLAVVFILKATAAQGPIGLAKVGDRLLGPQLRVKIAQPLGAGSAPSPGAFLAFGALAAKALTLGSMGPWQCARAVVVLLVAGRSAMVLGCTMAECTAEEDRIEHVLWPGRSQEALLAALVAWGLTALLLLWSAGLFAFVLGLGYAAVYVMYCKRRFDGLDAQSLFALGEAVELVTVVVLAIF